MSRSANHFCKLRQACRRVLVHRGTWLILLACAVLATPGCVRRRLTVRSNPAGALVYVDNQQIGTTPCSVDFTYYGTREIRLIKPGYETLTVNQPIPTPWYQIPGIDFVSENLTPQKIRDNRTVTFDMQPQIIVPREQILERAEELRQETMQGLVVPASTAPPTTMLPPSTIAPPPGAILPPPPGAFGPPPSTIPSAMPSTSAPFLPMQPTVVGPPVAAPGTAPSPFAPPDLTMPAEPQRGRPIVSPPLR
jgi:hypothetical protein